MYKSGRYENDFYLKKRKNLFYMFHDKKFVFIPNRVAHHDNGLTIKCFLDSHVYPRRTSNFFAVPKEKQLLSREKTRAILIFWLYILD